VGEHPELDLLVVGGEEEEAGAGQEGGPQVEATPRYTQLALRDRLFGQQALLTLFFLTYLYLLNFKSFSHQGFIYLKKLKQVLYFVHAL
jgi:hypothetical protein